MTPQRPYLLRAIFDWIIDNGNTPYLMVDAEIPNVMVPPEHVKDGRIVLNISPAAVQRFIINNHAVEFSARFSGVPQALYIPMQAVLAIYARENGQGLGFPEEDFSEVDQHRDQIEAKEQQASENTADAESKGKKKADKSHLKVIK